VWLPLAEFWYNTSHHSAIGRSLFEALYGQTPRQFGLSAASQVAVSSLDSWVQEHQVMTRLIKQHLQRVAVQMKHQTDKNRSERQFNVRDSVYLKL
jgi:hypothetical protein